MDIEAGGRLVDSTSEEFPAPPNTFRLIAGGNYTRRRTMAGMAPERPILPVLLFLSIVQSDSTVATDDEFELLETGFKIGIWATGISIPGFISVFMGALGFQASSLVEKLLVVTAILAMLTSCISGGILLILPVFRLDPPLPISKIKAIIAVAIASMAIVVCIGLWLKLFRIWQED